MVEVGIYNEKGEKLKSVKLASPEEGARKDLIYQAFKRGRANVRQVLSSTKTRAQVRGGGKKPWRQKGTGRARAGSSRSPIWVGGGVAFGPKSDRNFKKKMNKKARRGAVRDVLISKAKNNQLLIIDKCVFKKPSTKELLELVANLKLTGKTLFVWSPDPVLEKSVKNIIFAKFLTPAKFNIVDLLSFDNVIFDKDSWEKIVKIYLGKLAGEAKKGKAKKEEKANLPKTKE